MSDIQSKGGKIRAQKLTPERRRAIAEKAASMRWAKEPVGMTASKSAVPSAGVNGEVLPPSPFAKFRGQMDLGGNSVDVYVLDTGQRVISLRATVKILTGTDGGILEDYIGVTALKSFLNSDLVLEETRDFYIPGTQFRGKGV